MPKMDGISFLRNLMRLHPMPVIMISSLTEAGADVALEALALGAVDYISKPKEDIADNLEAYSAEIISKVKAAAASKFFNRHKNEHRQVSKNVSETENANQDSLLRNKISKSMKMESLIIAIGASTGGTEAIKEILMNVGSDMPPMVISQHIPRAFSSSFAKRMNSVSKLLVCEASDGQFILPGHVYIAPGDLHLEVKRKNNKYYCHLNNGEPVNRHKPSVDVMFDSVAEIAADNSIGVLLTGMGADGAYGMKNMREAGACTIAQDETSSVVWGMPGEAVKLKAVDMVLPLGRIADKLTALVSMRSNQ